MEKLMSGSEGTVVVPPPKAGMVRLFSPREETMTNF